MFHDLRYAVRMLLKSPGFTVIAILTLALGIGANSAIFSVVDSVLLRPLPFPEAEQLVTLSETRSGFGEMSVAYPNYLDWRKAQHSFKDLSVLRQDDFNLTGNGEPERLQGAFVTASFFRVMGLAPKLGRVFSERADRAGGANVVVLSEGLWRRRFGGDPHVIGQSLALNGIPYEVIGVMPRALATPFDFDLFAPFGYYADRHYLAERDSHAGLYGVARLKAGTSIEDAETDFRAICKNLERQFPATNTGNGVRLAQLLKTTVGEYQATLWLLTAAAGFVLLIVCANVALLLLVRATAREREIAIRTALGASRGRVVAQLLIESSPLALIGGGLGLLLAAWGVDAIGALIPPDIPRFHEVHLDGRVLAFTGALSIGTGVIFGILPALKMARPNLSATFHEGGRSGTAGRGRLRTQTLLVIAQIALACVLLTGAGLLSKSLLGLHNAKLGFNPNHLLTMKLKLPGWKYHDQSNGTVEMAAFYRTLLEQVRGLAGVRAVALSDNPPFAGDGSQNPFAITGQPDPKPGEETYAEAQCVSPAFFQTMGMPLLRGRGFDGGDSLGKARVVIVDESFAQRYFPGQNPIGQQINNLGRGAERRQFTIVGVVPTVQRESHATGMPTRVQIYYPAAQYPSLQTTLVVRTDGDPLSWSHAIRRAVLAIDPTLPVFDVRTMENWISDSFSTPRLASILVGLFSALALLLAALGLYGTLAYTVAQRTREIGIRMALGARRRQMLAMILRESLTMAIIGIGAGVLGAFAATRLLRAMLFGVGAADVATYSAVILLLGTAALLAAFFPARRAMNVDPIVALRTE